MLDYALTISKNAFCEKRL